MDEQNFLTAADAAQVSIGGFAALDVHLRMLRDVYRVLAEIGWGTGVLSLFAAKAGARSVVAIEETSIADVAEHMFERNGRCSSPPRIFCSRSCTRPTARRGSLT